MNHLRMPQSTPHEAIAPPVPDANAPSPKLVSAAHEFEAALMKELMAPLASGHDLIAGDSEDHDSESALTSFAGEALGKAISEHGGLGIAKSILQHLSHSSHNGNHFGKTSVPGLRNGTTSNSPPL